MNQHNNAADPAAITIDNLGKSYQLGRERLPVLCGLSLTVNAGEMVVIMGPSGSGKTTLLNCISAIDTPQTGSVCIAGQAVDYGSERSRTLLRRHQVGMVFQFFNLIPTLTVRENIRLPFLISGEQSENSQIKVENILTHVGMSHRAGHYPQQLSGGEMQLTSIARALVHQPCVLLADEPTGNVNPNVGNRILNILRDRAKQQGTGILMVTHSPEHAAWADRICFLKEGAIADELQQNGDRHAVAAIYDHLLKLDI